MAEGRLRQGDDETAALDPNRPAEGVEAFRHGAEGRREATLKIVQAHRPSRSAEGVKLGRLFRPVAFAGGVLASLPLLQFGQSVGIVPDGVGGPDEIAGRLLSRRALIDNPDLLAAAHVYVVAGALNPQAPIREKNEERGLGALDPLQLGRRENLDAARFRDEDLAALLGLVNLLDAIADGPERGRITHGCEHSASVGSLDNGRRRGGRRLVGSAGFLPEPIL
jgi:hypothetical protein